MYDEVQPGDQGQLATILDLVVQPDNSVIVTAIGDLDCTVVRTWMPRGLRGLQLAFVDVHKEQACNLKRVIFDSISIEVKSIKRSTLTYMTCDSKWTLFSVRSAHVFCSLRFLPACENNMPCDHDCFSCWLRHMSGR